MFHTLLFVLLFSGMPACRPHSDTETFPFQLGQTTLTLEQARYDGPAPLFIVHVHDNEATARLAAGVVLDSTGGSLLSLRNGGNRLVRFRMNGGNYVADPNRIFTPAGRRASLEKGGRFAAPAEAGLAAFASFFLGMIPDSGAIVSMHNNTPDAYSICSYDSGGLLAKEAAGVHVNPQLDPDDFYITTSPEVFERLRDRDRNVVLQANESVEDDGSLSVFFGLRNRDYVNIEAEHGHLEVQVEMLRVLAQVMEGLTLKIESK